MLIKYRGRTGSPLGQVRDTCLCLGSFVSKITNSKHQITNKSQILNYKFQTGSKRLFFLFGILNFGHCYLFVFWDLLFGISISQ